MTRISIIALLSATLLVSACAGGQYGKTKIGAGVGAVVGAVAGSQLGDESTESAAIGAALGALAGGAVGLYMDKQEQALQQRLQAERAADVLNIVRLNGNALKIGVASDASFAVDSATLSPGAQVTFNKIANVLKDFEKTAIHVVGHTDSTGRAEYNLQLSQQRARAVANFLISRGVDPQRVLTWGRGETQPIASNDTAAGRAANRRVDIVIKPIVEGRAQAAFTAPPYLGM